MLNLRKLSFLKVAQDMGQILKNGFYGPDYKRPVFRQAVWEECRSSISPLLQLGKFGRSKQGLHSPSSQLNGPQSRGGADFSALVISTLYEAVL